MKYNPMTRRMFLQGAGGVLLSIPFLPSLLRAQTAKPNPFFIIVPMRECFDRYRTWSLNKTLPFTQLDAVTRERSLMQLAAADGRISEILDASWNPYLNKMNLFTHLSMYSDSNLHSSTIMGCADNRENGPFYSIDYLIRNKFRSQGYRPALDLLQVNFQRSLFTDYTRLTHWGAETRPTEIFDNAYQLEAKLMPAIGSGGGAPAPTPTPSVNFKGKMVDAVFADYQKLINSGKLSGVDKLRLNDAIAQWNEIENRSVSMPVTTMSAGSCSPLAKLKVSANLGEQQRHAVDMIVAAINCGILQVVNHGLIPLGDDIGDTRNETEVVNHEYAHSGDSDPVAYGKWRASVVRYYAEKLNSITGVDGQPLLDSGMVFWTSEYPGFGLHQAHGRTVLTLGGASGRFKTGYHVNGGNAPLSRAHITVMKAYGLTQTEIEAKGEAGFGEYSTDPYTGDIHFSGVEWDNLAYKVKDRDFSFDSNGHAQFTTNDIEKRKAFTGFVK